MWPPPLDHWIRVSTGRFASISVSTVEWRSHPETYEPGLMPAQSRPSCTSPSEACQLGHSVPWARPKAALQNWFCE